MHRQQMPALYPTQPLLQTAVFLKILIFFLKILAGKFPALVIIKITFVQWFGISSDT